MQINEHEFLKMKAPDRDLIIFKNITILESKLDKRKFINSCVAFAGGVVGGISAVVVNWAYWAIEK